MKIRDCFYVNPSKNTNNHTDFINYIDTSSVTNGSLTSYDYLETDFPSRAQRLIKSDDILYSSVRPNLRHFYHYIDNFEHAVASTGFVLLRNKSNCNTKFVYYYLSTNEIVTHLSNIAELSQATFPSFSPKDLGKIDIPNYAVDKQQKIASILSAYDNLIEVNNKRIKVLEQMAENIYKEWFVRFRFPGHETTEFVNGLPKGWENKHIFEFYHTSSGGTPSRENLEYYANGNIPWIKTGELQDCIITTTEEFITDEAIKKSSAKPIPKDSIIMAMYGVNIGKLGYTSVISTCNQACCVFSDKRNIKSHFYLFFFLKSIREYLLSISFGAAQQNLSQELIKRIKIVMPDNNTLKIFQKQASIIFETITVLIKNNENLIKQRDLLLPRLMSGKLEV